MRAAICAGLVRLPFKLGSGIGWLAGLLSAAAPERMQAIVGAGVSASAIQNIGIGLLAVSSLYFALLWLLKPPAQPVPGGPTYTGPNFHIYQTLPEKLAGQMFGALPAPSAPVQIAPDDGTHSHTVTAIRGSSSIRFRAEGKLTTAPGSVIRGLYVGNVIVAAGALESEHRLELAIVGYNGSLDTLRLSEISGRIRAGTGNMRDMVNLNTPLAQGILHALPDAEFVLTLRQDVTSDQALEYLAALEEGKPVSLDLRELCVVVCSTEHPDRFATLPLWDGVMLRRRDDVVSNRNTIISIDLPGIRQLVRLVRAETEG